MEKEGVELLKILKALLEAGENCECKEADSISDSLREDYDGFMKWAFGTDLENKTRLELKKNWEKLHPSLTIPRVLKTELDLGKTMTTICLIMDAYGYYINSKK